MKKLVMSHLGLIFLLKISKDYWFHLLFHQLKVELSQAK